MVKINILINARGCACNSHRVSITYVTPLVSAMSIKTRAMVDVLHSDRYPHCNSRTNFTNLAKHFAVHGSWNIWVDVPAIITACYISQFGYESREIHCKLQVLSVYMCPYINTTAINEQRRVAETPWQHPTGGNLFGGNSLALQGARNLRLWQQKHQTVV